MELFVREIRFREYEKDNLFKCGGVCDSIDWMFTD